MPCQLVTYLRVSLRMHDGYNHSTTNIYYNDYKYMFLESTRWLSDRAIPQ